MIKLNKFEKSDFGRLKSWITNKKDLIQFAGSIFSFPLDDKQLEIYLHDKRRIPFKVILEDLNEVIGHCELNLENLIPRLSRILIGKEEMRNLGYGKAIVSELLEIAFNNFKTESVDLNVFDWNQQGIKCYQKIGFKFNEGMEVEYQMNNQKWTSKNMVITKQDWEALKKGAKGEL